MNNKRYPRQVRHSFDGIGLSPGCTPDSHRWEFWKDEHGITEYVCLSCGETMVQFSDTQGC